MYNQSSTVKNLPAIALFCTLAPSVFAQTLTIVNAASLSAVSVAPNTIITIKGKNLSSGVAVAPDPSNPPATLGGVTVTIGGTAAALFYVSPSQINALVGASTPLGNEPVVVTSGTVQQNGTVTIAANAPPGLFSKSGSGMRDGAILNAVTFLGGDFSAQTQNGAPAYLALFGTGISLTSAPTVTVGGVAAQVLFYGAAPCCKGLEQVNVLLPPSTAGAGTVPLALTSNGQVSNTVDVHLLPPHGMGPFPGDNDNETPSRELSTVAYVPGTSLVLVADENDDVVRVVDVSAQKVTQVITLPEGSGPEGIAVNAAGTTAVVLESDLGKAAILDLTKFVVVTEIATGMSPVSVTIAGTQAIVVNQDADTASIIDLTSNTVQKTVNVGHGPAAVAADATLKQAYVVNEADGTLSVIDLAGLTVTKTVSLGEATRGEQIAMIPGAGILFITVPAAGPEGEVLVVNVASAATTTFQANPSGTGGSTGIAYFNSHLYLANQTGGSVSVVPVSPTTGATTGTPVNVKVDLGARALAIDAKNNLLVVSNEGSGTIVLVNLATNQVTAHINAVQTNGQGDDNGDDHSDRGGAHNGPAASQITPNTGKVGTTFSITITGMNLTGATSVTFLAPGNINPHGKLGDLQSDSSITANSLKVSPDGTQLTATLAIAASAQPGPRLVVVTTPNGSTQQGDQMSLLLTVTP